VQVSLSLAGLVIAPNKTVAGERLLMDNAMKALSPGSEPKGYLPSHNIFTAWRLQAYGLTIAGIYAAFFISIYRAGAWFVDGKGLPIYTEAGQSIAIVLFALTFAALLAYGDREGGITFGNVPLGPFVLVTLLALVLRRLISEEPHGSRPEFGPNFKRFETPVS